ncbi:hypothetical protein [Erwinia rhapontici]|uniref:hypothetical protein n=1 Tax=Erwinia rhapontici TaxID=55212 RepID=UPI003BA1A237
MHTHEFKKNLLLIGSVIILSSGCQMQKNDSEETTPTYEETTVPYALEDDPNLTRECRYYHRMTGAPMSPMAYKALQDKCIKSNESKKNNVNKN